MKRTLTVRVLAVSLLMSLSISGLAYAGEWKRDDIGWWWQEDNGSYPTNCWKWLDGDRDGLAECYYFGDQGYMLVNTTIGDDTVNADGVWTVDGEVQYEVIEYDEVYDRTNRTNRVDQYSDQQDSGSAENDETESRQKSQRERLDEMQDKLYEAVSASREKRQEVLYEYFDVLGVDPTGLEIEEGRISYFAMGDSRSANFFRYSDVLTAILLYMGDKSGGVNTIHTSEGNYSYTAYLLVQTTKASNELKKAGW